MKLTICGSIFFLEEMRIAQRLLEEKGHEVHIPPGTLTDAQGQPLSTETFYICRKTGAASDRWIWELKAQAMQTHFDEIDWAEAILVLNFQKKGVVGYIGGSTLLEMGLAFWLKKPIYLHREIPDLPYREEILAMSPILTGGDLNLIPLERRT
ncbi:MAG: hypothetical protein WA058_01530 [Minisyncoccia bacterium]